MIDRKTTWKLRTNSGSIEIKEVLDGVLIAVESRYVDPRGEENSVRTDASCALTIAETKELRDALNEAISSAEGQR